MKNPLPAILWFILSAIGLAILKPGGSPEAFGTFVIWSAASLLLANIFRMAAQWEKSLVFRLGKFQAVKGPGVFTVIPFIDSTRTVDTRIQTIDIPRQEAITKDNVPVTLDGVIFMRVVHPENAIIQVQDYIHAIRQYALTTLRDVVGTVTLDQLLADREALGERIERMVEKEIDGWGLEVPGIRIQDIILPEDLKRVMSREASAEREKRANITKSEGDRDAASNLAAAAATMHASPGALQLRTLQTLDSLGTSSANTVVLAVPVDVMQAIQSVPSLATAATRALDHIDKQVALPEAAKAVAPVTVPLADSFFKAKAEVATDVETVTESA
ncbi:HflC Membrane protease subunits, stomatin/prohibitin homologs [Fimbriimonadaceae bacterium]